jgi:hypothetical protein
MGGATGCGGEEGGLSGQGLREAHMNASLFEYPWWDNNLLDESVVEQKAQQLLRKQKDFVENLSDWLAQHAHVGLAVLNEAQLEHDFIWPLLAHLGWQAVPQQNYTVQGKQAKPDWTLLRDTDAKQSFVQAPDVDQKIKHISAIAEAKAWDVPLDTGKANTLNPHHQLQDYLSTLRTRHGILTNGRHWRLYDTQKVTARKTYVHIDLEQVLQLPDLDEKHLALARFALFFSCHSVATPATPAASKAAKDDSITLAQLMAEAQAHALAVEENLKAVIYGYDGEDSLFEQIGLALWKAQTPGTNAKPKLDTLYENTVIFLFRLLFIVYFEDRNKDLLAKHPFYQNHSLKSLYWRLRREKEALPPLAKRTPRFDGIFALKHLFDMLDQGAQDIDIPLFNGGLFDPERAPLLQAAKIFDNQTLGQILDKLLFKTHRGDTLFDSPRDFNTMSVTHLGRIYEGLLEFRFERAHESAVYLEYQSQATQGKAVEAYFDDYDAAVLRKQKGFKTLRELSVRKGDIHLKSASNSRKTSASYYTPSSLSQRLVKAGIEQALAAGKPLTEIRILDNACGSGHFLVEALGHLTDLALAALPDNAELQTLVAQEREKIEAQLAFLNLDSPPSDAQIIKRVLLKRCIYGVDLNPFAVELARLSLWMDSFVFGTPLSFIEHHIRHGNALLGATVKDFVDYNSKERGQGDLFAQDLHSRFDELRQVMTELDHLRDSTPDEVSMSKSKWRDDIAPRLSLLSRTLDFVSTRRMLLAADNKAAVEAMDKTPDLLELLFDTPLKVSAKSPAVLRTLAEQSQRWHFFHYEVAFPEVFGGESDQPGFDVVLGNPPWDKTKLSDTDFFPQYHSSYRQLKNTEKEAVQTRLLASPHIKAAYEHAQASTQWANEAYKNAYPLNKGSGDGNLFRFFVERNLALLKPGGSLCYCLPSALMFEEGSQTLRCYILKSFELRFFYSFENNLGIFADVHRSYKFALMQVCKPVTDAAVQTTIDSAFYVLNPDELDEPTRRVPYPLQALQTLSPQQWAMMELRHAADLPLLQKCYSAHPTLRESWLDFRNELHMTNDKDLFKEKQAVGLLPLFEGKMIWQYSHKLDEAQYWLNPTDMDARMRSKEIHRMAGDLGIKKKEAQKHHQAVRFDREYVRLGFRDIARDTDERTLVFALVPVACGVGNTINISVPKIYRFVDPNDAQTVEAQTVSPLRLLLALAWFNSLPVDWLARFMIQIHANKTYLYRLPMPQPDDAAILGDECWRMLARHALLLTLYASWDDFADSLAPALQALGVRRGDVPTTAKACDLLRAENDKIVAQAYGLNAADFAHLLKSFPGMQHKRPEYTVALRQVWDAPLV